MTQHPAFRIHPTVNLLNPCADVLSRCPADRSTGQLQRSSRPDSGLARGAACVCARLLQTADSDFVQLLFLPFSVKQPPHPQPDQTGVKLYSRPARWSASVCAQSCGCSLKHQESFQTGRPHDRVPSQTGRPLASLNHESRLQRVFLDCLLPRTPPINCHCRQSRQ